MKTYANLVDPKVFMVNTKGIDFKVETARASDFSHTTYSMISPADRVATKKLAAGVAPEEMHISQRAHEIYEAMTPDVLQDLCDGEAALPPEIVRVLDSDATAQLYGQSFEATNRL